MKNVNNQYTQLGSLQSFEFAKTPVMAGNVHTGEMIAIRPCVENLGLNWSGQLQAIKRNESISELCASVKAIAEDGKLREMVCLPPSAFQNWLWSLNPKSENLNIELWEEYKKGLVLSLMMMLKVSLEHIRYLENYKRLYQELSARVSVVISADEEALEARRRGLERRKEKFQQISKISDLLKVDPKQTKLEL